MEKGTSFDGANIYAFIYTVFDNLKAIQYWKEFYGPVTLEGKSTGYAEFDMAYQLDYGGSDTNQPDTQNSVISASEGSSWDSGLAWDTGIAWDDATLVPTVGLDLRGEGRNIGWVITKDSDYFEPILLTGVHFRYMNTVQVRG